LDESKNKERDTSFSSSSLLTRNTEAQIPDTAGGRETEDEPKSEALSIDLPSLLTFSASFPCGFSPSFACGCVAFASEEDKEEADTSEEEDAEDVESVEEELEEEELEEEEEE